MNADMSVSLASVRPMAMLHQLRQLRQPRQVRPDSRSDEKQLLRVTEMHAKMKLLGPHHYDFGSHYVLFFCIFIYKKIRVRVSPGLQVIYRVEYRR